MSLEQTYTVEQGPAPPRIDDYLDSACGEYRQLLDAPCEEPKMQLFLERNPVFVPGARAPHGKGHSMHCALIRQPELTGLRSRRPDFLWIAAGSGAWYPTFIEIESPEKRVFRNDEVPTAQFTEARNQLAQWRVWLDDPQNVAKFAREYGVPDIYTRRCVMRPQFILIYGRRIEFEGNPRLSKQRGMLMGRLDEHLMSYDGLEPNRLLSDAITVSAIGDGRYRVEAVMPTITLGPNLADRLPHVDGLASALLADERIPAERRTFLASRVGYWTEWAGRHCPGIMWTSDVE